MGGYEGQEVVKPPCRPPFWPGTPRTRGSDTPHFRLDSAWDSGLKAFLPTNFRPVMIKGSPGYGKLKVQWVKSLKYPYAENSYAKHPAKPGGILSLSRPVGLVGQGCRPGAHDVNCPYLRYSDPLPRSFRQNPRVIS